MADEVKEYLVLSRIDGDRRYEAGDTIKLSDQDAAPLLATSGPCIEPITEGGGLSVLDKPVADMTLPELKAYAKSKGVAFAGNAGEAKMRELIAAADTTPGSGEGAQQ